MLLGKYAQKFLTNGTTGTITTPDALVATGSVTVTATAGAATKQAVTYEVVDANGTKLEGWTVTGLETELTTDAAGDKLSASGVTITAPSNVNGFKYSIAVNGLTTTENAVAGTQASGNSATSINSGFLASTAKLVAKDAVKVTVTITDATVKYTVSVNNTSSDITGSSVTWNIGSQNDLVSNQISVDATGKVSGTFTSSTLTAMTKAGTVTVKAIAGAKGEASAPLAREATTVSIPNLTLSDFTGETVYLEVSFKEADKYAVTTTYGSGAVIAGTSDSSDDVYTIAATTGASTNVVTNQGYVGETITVKVTAAKGTDTNWATGTVKLVVKDADGTIYSLGGTSEIVFNDGNGSTGMTATFTMPAEAVTLTLTYTAP